MRIDTRILRKPLELNKIIDGIKGTLGLKMKQRKNPYFLLRAAVPLFKPLSSVQSNTVIIR